MGETVEWQCPYCLHWSQIERPAPVGIGLASNAQDLKEVYFTQVVCLNSNCARITLSLKIYGMIPYGDPAHRGKRRGEFRSFSLLPNAATRPQPSYIPAQIVNDYNEACAVVNISPKASATLIRRCLQGMIRDFFGVSERTLNAEINKIKGRVSEDLWEAIDSIRKIGNIGAHMESDVNLVIDVETEEATVLIGLVEQLFREWYVERHNRESRINSIKAIAAEKAAQKSPGTVNQTQLSVIPSGKE